MNNDTRSPAEIEREIEHERAELAQSLSALQERFSVEGIARQFTEQVSRHGSDIGHSVGRSVKDNPVALALTGIGLAWMMFGDGYGRSNGRDRSWPETHPGAEPQAATSFGATGAGTSAGPDGGSAFSAASRAANSVSDRWDRMSEEADRYGRRMRASAEDMRRRLDEGTESLTEEARRRVIQAREAAWRAQAQIEKSTQQGWAGARNFFEDQPLVAGALAMAVGAALGAALPRTRTEDETVGAWSDQVFDEAERVFREERDKAGKVVKAAASEAKTVVREKKAQADRQAPAGKTAAREAADEAKSAAGRVARAAKDEAKRQNLGKPTH